MSNTGLVNITNEEGKVVATTTREQAERDNFMTKMAISSMNSMQHWTLIVSTSHRCNDESRHLLKLIYAEYI